MKKKIFVSIALLALLAACDDHYDDQFNIKPDITDVKDIAMTLETADYGTISKLSANQEQRRTSHPSEDNKRCSFSLEICERRTCSSEVRASSSARLRSPNSARIAALRASHSG